MNEAMSQSNNVVLACQGLTKIYRQGTGEGAEVPVLTGVSFVLSLVATIYPSWRASRVNPAEALRYE